MKSCEKDTRSISKVIRLYDVGFRLQPGEAAIVSGRRAQMTCRLELSGHHDHRVQSGNTPCANCVQLLQVLVDVAATLRPIEHEILERAGIVCETHLSYASVSGPGHEEILGVEMTLRHPIASMADSWVWIFMRHVRAALAELGCRNRAPAEPLGCRPPIRNVRRGRAQGNMTSADDVAKVSRLTA